jgi:hypothetical protein
MNELDFEINDEMLVEQNEECIEYYREILKKDKRNLDDFETWLQEK